MEQRAKPPRVVGLAGATLINLNATVGAGIFALPSLLETRAGGFAPFAIVLFALAFVPLAAVMAKLSQLFDQSGGPELYAEYSFGRFVGFQVGWLVICANFAARAANFHVLVSYLAALFPVFGAGAIRVVTVVGLIGATTLLSIVGTRRTLRAIWLGTALKLVPLIALALAGLAINGVPRAVSLPQLSEIESVALLIAYAFSGVGMAVISAGETRDATRTVYRSIYLNLALVTALYVLIQLAYSASVEDQSAADIPLAALGEALFGQTGVVLVSLAAIFSIATNQITGFLVLPRLLYGMGVRGLLPKSFAQVSARFGTPAFAIGFFGGVVALLAASGSFAVLATMTAAADQVFLGASVISLAVLWWRNEAGLRERLGWRWFAILGIAGAPLVWLVLQVPAREAFYTALLVALGSALYWFARSNAVAYERARLARRG